MPYVPDDELKQRQYDLWRSFIENFDLDNPEFVKIHDLNNKIQWRSKEFGIPEDEIRKDLRNSRISRYPFVKNPTRMNLGEKWAGEVIENINGVLNFKKVQPGDLYLVNGGIMTKQQLADAGVNANQRGIDFTWKYNRREFFSTQKHIALKGSGSHQSNQYDEETDWIKEANRNNSERIFVALADGPYFNEDRFNKLETLCDNSHNVFVSRTMNLREFLQRFD